MLFSLEFQKYILCIMFHLANTLYGYYHHCNILHFEERNNIPFRFYLDSIRHYFYIYDLLDTYSIPKFLFIQLNLLK
jgi:hypothetical protein